MNLLLFLKILEQAFATLAFASNSRVCRAGSGRLEGYPGSAGATEGF